MNKKNQKQNGSVCDGEKDAAHVDSYLRFSRLLLNSLIMSDRKSRRTSMLSGDGGAVFSRAATTFRISINIQGNKARREIKK